MSQVGQSWLLILSCRIRQRAKKQRYIIPCQPFIQERYEKRIRDAPFLPCHQQKTQTNINKIVRQKKRWTFCEQFFFLPRPTVQNSLAMSLHKGLRRGHFMSQHIYQENNIAAKKGFELKWRESESRQDRGDDRKPDLMTEQLNQHVDNDECIFSVCVCVTKYIVYLPFLQAFQASLWDCTWRRTRRAPSLWDGTDQYTA